MPQSKATQCTQQLQDHGILSKTVTEEEEIPHSETDSREVIEVN